MNQKLFIPFNKNKTLIMLISTLILIGLALYVYAVKEQSLFGALGNNIAVIALAICIAVVVIKLIFDLVKKDRGLYFSDEGIQLKDESGSAVNIPIEDISSIKIEAYKKTSYLLVFPKNAHKYRNIFDKSDSYNNKIKENLFKTPLSFDLSRFDLKNIGDVQALQSFISTYFSAKDVYNSDREDYLSAN